MGIQTLLFIALALCYAEDPLCDDRSADDLMQVTGVSESDQLLIENLMSTAPSAPRRILQPPESPQLDEVILRVKPIQVSAMLVVVLFAFVTVVILLCLHHAYTPQMYPADVLRINKEF